MSDKTSTKWWNEVVVTSPNPTVNADKSTWVNAYNVPDAETPSPLGWRTSACHLLVRRWGAVSVHRDGVMQEFSKRASVQTGQKR